ncbi:hypothetical protein [Clostridium sp.]|uniref:hypothetical protein n=1 Tax=Clostridium sp. TaxID=1506 RepID=UPI002846373E|nr:hypothetical protein [Clostridium sp.]MDR3595109.1 hypothetical protein [Clostridium sp.]
MVLYAITFSFSKGAIMKIKILTFVSRKEVGTLTDLKQDDVINIDDTIAEKLIKDGKAEFQF